MAKLLFALFCVIALSTIAQSGNYDGYKVLHVTFTTPLQYDMLYELDLRTNTNKDLMFWQLSKALQFADIMVAPHREVDFIAFLRVNGYNFTVMIEDVQKSIEKHTKTSGVTNE